MLPVNDRGRLRPCLWSGLEFLWHGLMSEMLSTLAAALGRREEREAAKAGWALKADCHSRDAKNLR